MKNRVVLALGVVIVSAALMPAGVARAEVIKKGLVILVEFPDVKPSIERDAVMMRFSRQLNGYIRQMSYGKVSLDIDVTDKWYTMPDAVSRYKISPRNLEVDKSRVRKLIDDALNAADRDVDFSKYDFSVILMSAKLEDYGMIGLCGYPGMLGWSNASALRTGSGQTVKGGVAIFCYQAHLGTLFHDIAHILGGVKDGKRMVPCLYDHDLQAKPGPTREVAVNSMVNMGYWDPMSCHFYRWGQPPPGISSWTKMRLGWLEPSKVKVVNPREQTEVMLGALEDGSSETLAVKVPLSTTTYYLIENRQPIGPDRVLPQHGVLIMYADDKVAECRRGQAPVKLVDANPSVPHLEGAAFDVGKTDTYRDGPNRIEIKVAEKVGTSYRIVVGPATR